VSVSTEPETQVFLLPDLGEGLAEAEVVEWKVALGDTVVIDQVVVEVETAKAVVEVPSPYAGMVEALHGAAGATVIVGSPLITIAATAGAAVPSAPGAPPSHEQHREEERAGSGNVLIGYGTSEASTRRRRRVRRDATNAEPSARTEAPPATTAPPAAPAPPVRVLSPVVRKLARDNDIDISTLDGSGLAGVIRRRLAYADKVRLPCPSSVAEEIRRVCPPHCCSGSSPVSPSSSAYPSDVCVGLRPLYGWWAAPELSPAPPPGIGRFRRRDVG